MLVSGLLWSIFKKGLKEETEHRPRQDSLDVEFNYRRTLRKINPNGLLKGVLKFFPNFCNPDWKDLLLICLTKHVLASVLILAILIFVSQQQPSGELGSCFLGSVLFLCCRTGKRNTLWKQWNQVLRKGFRENIHSTGERSILVKFTKQSGEKQQKQQN